MADEPSASGTLTAPFTPEQMIRLFNLLGTSLIRSLLSQSELEYLLNHGHDFEDELTAIIRRFAQPILLSMPYRVPTDDMSALADVLTECRFHQFRPSIAAYFTDPQNPSAVELRIATIRDGIRGSDVGGYLHAHGFRAATLREAACLIKAHTHVLESIGSLTVYDSHGTVNRRLIPQIKKRRQSPVLTHVTTERYIRAGTCHVPVATRKDVNRLE